MTQSYFNVEALEKIFADCVALGKRKNHDYSAARDTILDNGVRGVVTRMDDKQARLMSLTKPGHEAAVKDESLEDTFRDQINYAAYGLMLLQGTWGVRPAEPPPVMDLWMTSDAIRRETGLAPGLMRLGNYEVTLDQLRVFMRREGKNIEPNPIHCRSISTIASERDMGTLKDWANPRAARKVKRKPAAKKRKA